MQKALIYEDTPADLERIEQFARDRRLELLGRTAEKPPASAHRTPRAQLVWDSVSDGLRSQEVLKSLPSDASLAMTPTELGAHMSPGPNGRPLQKGSVRASILNLRRVEKRLKKEGKLSGRVVQAEWSDADGSNRYYLEPEDKAVIERL